MVHDRRNQGLHQVWVVVLYVGAIIAAALAMQALEIAGLL